jgi:hypothetical protein
MQKAVLSRKIHFQLDLYDVIMTWHKKKFTCRRAAVTRGLATVVTRLCGGNDSVTTNFDASGFPTGGNSAVETYFEGAVLGTTVACKVSIIFGG